MSRNVYSSAVFAGVDLFALKFTWTGSSPSTTLGTRELRGTELPDGEDRMRIRIPLRSLILTQYRSVTDRQTDGFAIAYTALAKLALRSVVTTSNIFYFSTGKANCHSCHVRLGHVMYRYLLPSWSHRNTHIYCTC